MSQFIPRKNLVVERKRQQLIIRRKKDAEAAKAAVQTPAPEVHDCKDIADKNEKSAP